MSKLTRQQKVNRRRSRLDARAKNDYRRFKRISAPLESVEGVRKLAELDEFLSSYRHHQHSNLVPEMLEIVENLDLIRNPQHTRGISAAIAALTYLHPRDGWAKHPNETVRRALAICPINSICPDIGDEGDVPEQPISDEHQVVQKMIWWMITGNFEAVQDVCDLVRSDGHLQEHATETLAWYAGNHQDLSDWLKTQHQGRKTRDVEDVDVNQEALHRIRLALPADLRNRVAYLLEKDKIIEVGIYGLQESEEIPARPKNIVMLPAPKQVMRTLSERLRQEAEL